MSKRVSNKKGGGGARSYRTAPRRRKSRPVVHMPPMAQQAHHAEVTKLVSRPGWLSLVKNFTQRVFRGSARGR